MTESAFQELALQIQFRAKHLAENSLNGKPLTEDQVIYRLEGISWRIRDMIEAFNAEHKKKARHGVVKTTEVKVNGANCMVIDNLSGNITFNR